jgi:hypothetical protein
MLFSRGVATHHFYSRTGVEPTSNIHMYTLACRLICTTTIEIICNNASEELEDFSENITLSCLPGRETCRVIHGDLIRDHCASLPSASIPPHEDPTNTLIIIFVSLFASVVLISIIAVLFLKWISTSPANEAIK